MAKLTLAMSVFAGLTAFCGAAVADSTKVGPAYIGDRSADPEDETFAYVVKTEDDRPLAFVGPARNVGLVTGDAEKDTIAYRPLLGVQRGGRWSFVLARECGVSDAARPMDCRLPPSTVMVLRQRAVVGCD